MVIGKLAAAAVLLFSVGASAGAPAATAETCTLGGKYPVRSVSSYNIDVNEGYLSYRRFRGAEIVVPAQPGLTGEWLQRVLSADAATGACDFGARNVTVDVASAGDGFVVRLSGADDRTAGEILRRAQTLVK